MTTDREAMLRERAAFNKQWGELYPTVAAILFELDPMGINFETNTDEYEFEAKTIIPRLAQARTQQDVETIVHQEFCHWFGAEEAGVPASYALIAARIWDAWCRFNRAPSPVPIEVAHGNSPGSTVQS